MAAIAIVCGTVSDTTLDIPGHDWYIVFSTFLIFLVFSIFYILSGIGYYLRRNRQLNNGLTKTHIGLTLVGFLISVVPMFIIFMNAPPKRSEITFEELMEFEPMAYQMELWLMVFVGVLLQLIGFCIYYFNMFYSWSDKT